MLPSGSMADVNHNRIDANVRCPSCGGPLFPRVLVCDSCGLKVEGDFVLNEFDSLTPEELRFLRVFVHCEGRIRDMEAALGVSYPTVKAGLASLKEKLRLSEPEPAQASSRAAALSADEVLARLESGAIGYEEALGLIRGSRPRRGEADGNERPGSKDTGDGGTGDDQQGAG